MGPAYLDLLLHGVRVMAMELHYATVPMPSTTEFARHLNVWLLELCAKIKAGRGLRHPARLGVGHGVGGRGKATTKSLARSTSSTR